MVIDWTMELLSIMNGFSLIRGPAKRMDLDKRRVNTSPATRVTTFKITQLLHCGKIKAKWNSEKMHVMQRHVENWERKFIEILRKNLTTVHFIRAIRAIVSEVTHFAHGNTSPMCPTCKLAIWADVGWDCGS